MLSYAFIKCAIYIYTVCIFKVNYDHALCSCCCSLRWYLNHFRIFLSFADCFSVYFFFFSALCFCRSLIQHVIPFFFFVIERKFSDSLHNTRNAIYTFNYREPCAVYVEYSTNIYMNIAMCTNWAHWWQNATWWWRLNYMHIDSTFLSFVPIQIAYSSFFFHITKLVRSTLFDTMHEHFYFIFMFLNFCCSRSVNCCVENHEYLRGEKKKKKKNNCSIMVY